VAATLSVETRTVEVFVVLDEEYARVLASGLVVEDPCRLPPIAEVHRERVSGGGHFRIPVANRPVQRHEYDLRRARLGLVARDPTDRLAEASGARVGPVLGRHVHDRSRILRCLRPVGHREPQRVRSHRGVLDVSHEVGEPKHTGSDSTR
jgi:hypothetical protein